MSSAVSAMRALVVRSGQVLFVRVSGAGLGFVFQVVMARMLGAQGAGVLAIALTSLVVGSVVARFGADVLALRTAASLVERHDWRRLGEFERRIVFMVGSMALVLGIVGVWAGPLLAQFVFKSPPLATPWSIVALSLPPYSLIVLYGELMKGAERHKMAAFFQGVGIPLVAILGLAVFARQQPEPATVATIYTCAVWCVALVQVACWRMMAWQLARAGRATRRNVESLEAPSEVEYEPAYRSLVSLYGASMAAIAMAWTDLLLLGIWRPAAEVGLYNAATRLAMLTGFVLMAVNSVVAPRFAAAQTRGGGLELVQTARHAALLCTGATLPAVLIFAMFGETLLSLFGPEFVGAYLVLIILSLGQLVNAVTGPVGYLLNMTGHHRVEAGISIGAAILNLLLCVLCIPAYGLLGAAIASAAALTICNLVRLVAVRRFLGWWAYPAL